MEQIRRDRETRNEVWHLRTSRPSVVPGSKRAEELSWPALENFKKLYEYM